MSRNATLTVPRVLVNRQGPDKKQTTLGYNGVSGVLFGFKTATYQRSRVGASSHSFPSEGNTSADTVPLGLLGRRLAASKGFVRSRVWLKCVYTIEQGRFGLSRVSDTDMILSKWAGACARRLQRRHIGMTYASQTQSPETLAQDRELHTVGQAAGFDATGEEMERDFCFMFAQGGGSGLCLHGMIALCLPCNLRLCCQGRLLKSLKSFMLTMVSGPVQCHTWQSLACPSFSCLQMLPIADTSPAWGAQASCPRKLRQFGPLPQPALCNQCLGPFTSASMLKVRTFTFTRCTSSARLQTDATTLLAEAHGRCPCCRCRARCCTALVVARAGMDVFCCAEIALKTCTWRSPIVT